jgi:hypothetical protein
MGGDESITWLVVSTPLKNLSQWEDYPIYEMESHKSHVPNQQPDN